MLSILILSYLVDCRQRRTSSVQNEHSDGEYDYEHSIEYPYVDSEFGSSRWNYEGSTIVKVSEHVRLTSDDKSQKGRAVAVTPFEADSWMVEIDFLVHGSNPTIHGDGFAFWFTQDQIKEGNVFGANDKFKGLGVFFDTYANSYHPHGFPYISAMIGDGQTSYDHDHDNEATVSGQGCQYYFRGSEGHYTAKIRYFTEGILELEMREPGSKQFTNCFSISNVKGLNKGYLGLSAATGDVHDNHDIIALRTFLKLKTHYDNQQKPVDSHAHIDINTGYSSDVHSNSWIIVHYLIRFAGAGLIAGILFIAYRAYKNKSSKSYVLMQ